MGKQDVIERVADLQQGCREGSYARRSVGFFAGFSCIGLLLGGCYKLPDRLNAEIWWHNLEGGPIAEQRPPPPNADLPYPNLATVPPKPPAPEPAARQRLSAGLLVDRTNAQYAAAQNPIAPVPRIAAPPTPPADPDASTASLEATQAPPAKAPSPVTPAKAATANAAESVVALVPPNTPPNIPAGPPPPPVLPGIAVGPTIPTPPVKAPPKPPAAPPTPSAAARVPVPIGFTAGSAVLPPGADAQLKLLAQRRVNKPIDIVGFGEADEDQPQAQNAAITLGLLRARAVAAALVAAGVPANMLRIDAQAAGRGADARLVD